MTAQPSPVLPIDSVLNISASNAAQQRGSHGGFRYFGKLAPDVTGAVLDLSARHLQGSGPIRVLDPMCGSGTSLIESADRGWSAVGFDVNPIAVLYSKVKTRRVDRQSVLDEIPGVLGDLGATEDEVEEVFGATRNARRWFSPDAMRYITSIRRNVSRLPEGRERDLLKAVLISRVRRASNASERTGRIFFDPASARDVVSDFQRAALSIVQSTPDVDLPVHVVQADGRSLELADEAADIALVHPPYFALYRYSSDVLRFELELGGFSRAEVAKNEIREGWKSGDPLKLNGYAEDLADVLSESARIVGSDGVVALIASNSTLGDVRLPVIDTVLAAASSRGITAFHHVERTMHHGSAKYHRSARQDKVIERDHIVLLRRA